jgi:putative lipoprotein
MRSQKGIAMKRAHILAATALGALLVVAACVSQKPAEVAVTNALSGNWQVITLGGGTLPADADVTIDFAAPAVSGSSGCNRFTGTYSEKGNDLTFGPTAMTRKACQPQLMDIETGFAKALGAVTRYDMADGRLRFYVGDTLVMQARPR